MRSSKVCCVPPQRTQECGLNRITDRIKTGTVGELLVQLRLLQFGVQAAPPVKDSGNDLIAVNGHEFRAVSVRTTTTGTYNKPSDDRLYHVLAVVELADDEHELYLDASRIFFIEQPQVRDVPTDTSRLAAFEVSRERVEACFGALQV